MAKAKNAAYADNLQWYEALVATNPKVTRKGAAMPYTSLNGHMFSLLTPPGAVIIRLPDDVRDAFRKKYKTKPVVLYGALMKEYVEVPDALLRKTRELKKYFDASYKYTASLKPKPTKRNKP